MHITKLGHCCLVLACKGVTILTDPGTFTTAQDTQMGVDVVLITHEHADHFHAASLVALVKNNPEVLVVTNEAVAAVIAKEGIVVPVTVVGDGQSTTIKGVTIEGFGKKHAVIYEEMGQVENTGYLVDDAFYFPGDNFHAPEKPVAVLALPVAGPWMKLSDAVDFVRLVRPRVAFGVHDGMIVGGFRGFVGMVLKMVAPEVEYVSLSDGETKEF